MVWCRRGPLASGGEPAAGPPVPWAPPQTPERPLPQSFAHGRCGLDGGARPLRTGPALTRALEGWYPASPTAREEGRPGDLPHCGAVAGSGSARFDLASRRGGERTQVPKGPALRSSRRAFSEEGHVARSGDTARKSACATSGSFARGRCGLDGRCPALADRPITNSSGVAVTLGPRDRLPGDVRLAARAGQIRGPAISRRSLRALRYACVMGSCRRGT